MRIGAYELGPAIGQGVSGSVHEARDARMPGRVLAVKLVDPVNETRVERSVREAEMLARLAHPNVVVVHDAGFHEDRPFIVMELIHGPTLATLLDEGTPRDRLLGLVADAARGIAFAHENGIVHRDLKPANILVAPGGAKVCDFGLARQLDRETLLTLSGEMLGTLAYMAPEQARGEKATRASDVFALGAILYHVLAGRPPHVAPTAAALVLQVADGPIEPPSRLARRRWPLALEALCLRALARDPEARPRDGGAFLAELEAARRPRAGRARALLPALALGGGALIAAGVLASRRPRPPAPATPHPAPPPPAAPPKEPLAETSHEPAWFTALLAASSKVPPAWYESAPADEKPRVPEGVRFLGPGAYLNVADGTVLAWVARAHCFVGRHEVTAQQFARFVAQEPGSEPQHTVGLVGGVERPATWRTPDGMEAAPEAPVRQVAWRDAAAYARFARASLPTFSEWRQAIRDPAAGSVAPAWDAARHELRLGRVAKRGTSARADAKTRGVVPVEWCEEIGADPEQRTVARIWYDGALDVLSVDGAAWWATAARDDLTFRICRR